MYKALVIVSPDRQSTQTSPPDSRNRRNGNLRKEEIKEEIHRLRHLQVPTYDEGPFDGVVWEVSNQHHIVNSQTQLILLDS
jgi:hypothetical protein